MARQYMKIKQTVIKQPKVPKLALRRSNAKRKA